MILKCGTREILIDTGDTYMGNKQMGWGWRLYFTAWWIAFGFAVMEAIRFVG